MIPVNRKGESLPLLVPDFSTVAILDGTGAHAESAKLPEGVYRMAVESSVDGGGVHILTSAAGSSATASNGIFLGNYAYEYICVPEGHIVSVLGGKLNIAKFI